MGRELGGGLPGQITLKEWATALQNCLEQTNKQTKILVLFNYFPWKVHVCSWSSDVIPPNVRCVPLSSGETGVQHLSVQAAAWHQGDLCAGLVGLQSCFCGERQKREVLNCSL